MKKDSSRFLYALDIGSKKIALAAASMNKDGQLGQIFIETQVSRGIFKGVVNDLAALSDSLQQIFKKMEIKCNARAMAVALSINGNYIDARNSSVAMALSDRGTRSITQRDIDKLKSQARTLGLELDETLLHEYPQKYLIDRGNVTLNPLGLHGRKFEGDLLLICANTSYVENIVRAVEQSGLDVTNIVFSAVSAADAVLSKEEKEKGAILIDMGDSLTNILIFKDGILRKMNVLAFGGKNLSEVISNYCQVPLELADKIKETSLEIGHEIQNEEEVMVKAESVFRPIKKKELAMVVSPEIDRFITMLKKIIFESGVAGIASAEAVAIGGLSLLEGLLEKMEHDLSIPVKIGIVKGALDIAASKSPAYASVAGLLYMQKDSYLKSGIKLQSQGKNKIAQALDYITNLYQDYF